MSRPDAHGVLNLFVDHRSRESWDTPVQTVPADPGYAADLAAARRTTGFDESVITGSATVAGHPIAFVASEFGFLGGSIGADAGARIVSAVRRATERRLPLVALPASGGTRMQEGTPAFLQMVAVTAAVVDHKAAHLPYLVYLRHPTTGGVFASWGSLGHVTFAEPGALIGFLGPRVFEGLHGRAFPRDVQRAENLRAHGIVDIVTPAEHFASHINRTLSILGARGSAAPTASVSTPTPTPGARSATTATPDVWDAVVATRRRERPGVRELLRHMATSILTLNGSGEGESDSGLVVALARIGDRGVVVIGQDRRRQQPGSLLGPAALRIARRGIRLADDLDLPAVTVIDTPGAALSRDAEEGGLAGEIARCLADLIALRTPRVSVLLGQGAGGAALALLPADRVVATADAWLSPLPPEGASVIVHRDTDHAPEMARRQRIDAESLRADGHVDVVVDAPTHDADLFCAAVGTAIADALDAVIARSR